MDVVGRLSRRLLRRQREHSGAQPAPASDPLLSVLDLGTGAVKAAVVGVVDDGVEVLGYARQVYALAQPAGHEAAARVLVPAAERALEAAEDDAGVVPRRVVLGVPTAACAVGLAEVEVRRERPSLAIDHPEWQATLDKAQLAAQAAARRNYSADRGAAAALDTTHHVPAGAALDGRPVHRPVGARGERLQVAAAVVGALPAEEAHRRAVAETLDLEVAAVLAEPFALGAALAGAGDTPSLVVDVGADVTGVIAVWEHGVAGAAAFPVGAATLAGRICDALGVGPEVGREAVAAHAVGAGHRSSAGPAAGRVIAQLAQHHADVWLDALEATLADLARATAGRPLPARLLLCGGGASLPDLRRALAGTAWRLALQFERQPAIRLLLPGDLRCVRLAESIDAGPDATVPLSLAAAYASAELAASAADAEPAEGRARLPFGRRPLPPGT
jgi:cell division protein FtsA